MPHDHLRRKSEHRRPRVPLLIPLADKHKGRQGKMLSRQEDTEAGGRRKEEIFAEFTVLSTPHNTLTHQN
jgi:hypothetical protein